VQTKRGINLSRQEFKTILFCITSQSKEKTHSKNHCQTNTFSNVGPEKVFLHLYQIKNILSNQN